MTMGSLLVAGVLAILIAGAVVSIILEKRSGKCSCGCDCGCCGKDCCEGNGPLVPKD